MTTLDAIRDILHQNFDIDPEALQPNAKLADLAIDSLAVIEVMFAVEDRFHITVPAEPVAVQAQLTTVGELVAYIDKLIAGQHPAPASE
jgi:acyl carrier protein